MMVQLFGTRILVDDTIGRLSRMQQRINKALAGRILTDKCWKTGWP